MATKVIPQRKPPSQFDTQEAIDKMPAGKVIRVVQQPAITGKLDVEHRWHRDYAADKIRLKGAHRSYDATYAEEFGMYFTDDNGDRFYLETAPADVETAPADG